MQFRVGDVFERLADIPDGSIDLIVTSPPFLALRSYLPPDHPDKAKEIGSEAGPAQFLDTMLALTAEWGRVLAPHGSLCVELGDTYSGSGGGGGDYLPGGMRDGQQQFSESAAASMRESNAAHWRAKNAQRNAWPLAKSKTMLDTLYPACLAYNRNLLTGTESPAGPWRIRNLIVWARPNPPVGALGDKFRPATSYITVACRGPKRYFDLDAVRYSTDTDVEHRRVGAASASKGVSGGDLGNPDKERPTHNPAGAPPLDWHADHHPEDGDWLWKLSTQPYKGSHYATFPMALPKRLIEAMCPLKVCTVCGKPSQRITERTPEYAAARAARGDFKSGRGRDGGLNGTDQYHEGKHIEAAENITTGWTDCGHNTWRTGVVLDPFAGSGTTLEAAQAVGRHAIGIDLDERNAHLAQQRVGMFLEVDR